MDFSNQNITIEQLPTIDEAVFHPLEKTYLKVSRISFCISGLVVLIIGIAIFYFVDAIQTPAIIYTAAAVFILLSVVGWMADSLGFEYSGYALREKDILFRRGWFVRKVRVVPLKRVQHVSVQSGPIERKFGLASISIYTAGSEAADFTIKGITDLRAQELKEWISTQLNGQLN